MLCSIKHGLCVMESEEAARELRLIQLKLLHPDGWCHQSQTAESRSFHILLEVVERIASISRSEGIAKAPFHCYISPSTKAGTVGEQNE